LKQRLATACIVLIGSDDVGRGESWIEPGTHVQMLSYAARMAPRTHAALPEMGPPPDPIGTTNITGLRPTAKNTGLRRQAWYQAGPEKGARKRLPCGEWDGDAASGNWYLGGWTVCHGKKSTSRAGRVDLPCGQSFGGIVPSGRFAGRAPGRAGARPPRAPRFPVAPSPESHCTNRATPSRRKLGCRLPACRWMEARATTVMSFEPR
jgi:hypothetical protein